MIRRRTYLASERRRGFAPARSDDLLSSESIDLDAAEPEPLGAHLIGVGADRPSCESGPSRRRAAQPGGRAGNRDGPMVRRFHLSHDPSCSHVRIGEHVSDVIHRRDGNASVGECGHHRAELADEIGAAFRAETLDTWRVRMEGCKGPYAPVNNLLEVSSDAQVVANDFITTARADDGLEVPLVRAPVQIDEHKPSLGRAPRLGQHTREILSQLGYDTGEIDTLIGSNIARSDAAESSTP